MYGFYNFLLEKGDPHDIIPLDSYWAFRWGHQAIRTVLSFRERERLIVQGYTHGSEEYDAANEMYEQDCFACRYGRRGDAEFRAYVEQTRKMGVSDNELRSLIRYGDLRNKKGDLIQSRKSLVCASAGGIYIFLCIVAIFMMTALIIFASANVYIKMFLLFSYWGVLSGCAIAIFMCAVRPFLVLRRLSPILERAKLALLRSTYPTKFSIIQ